MPTPFYHLSVAENLLQEHLSGPAQQFLQRYRPQFLLGNTAPDVQTLSGQNRQETHFFDLPVVPGAPPPWQGLWATFPELRRRDGLSEPQAAFLVGYLCHLQADWLWVLDIFAPVFGPQCLWDTFRRRLYLHNVLRAYLDQRLLPGLPVDLSQTLQLAQPAAWLPFVSDGYLNQWRDWLAGQLVPGAAVETVEVFAARQGIPAEAYYNLIRSEESLDREVFSRLPRQALEAYRQKLLAHNLELIEDFLQG